MDIKTRYENALRAFVNDENPSNARTDTIDRGVQSGLVKRNEAVSFAKWLVKQGAGERVLHYAKDRYGVRSENKIHGEEVFTSIIKLPNGGETEILFIQEKDTGNLFAVEASYIEQEVGPIMSPYGNGKIILPE